jgi:translation initiation factor IF-2
VQESPLSGAFAAGFWLLPRPSPSSPRPLRQSTKKPQLCAWRSRGFVPLPSRGSAELPPAACHPGGSFLTPAPSSRPAAAPAGPRCCRRPRPPGAAGAVDDRHADVPGRQLDGPEREAVVTVGARPHQPHVLRTPSAAPGPARAPGRSCTAGWPGPPRCPPARARRNPARCAAGAGRAPATGPARPRRPGSPGRGGPGSGRRPRTGAVP